MKNMTYSLQILLKQPSSTKALQKNIWKRPLQIEWVTLETIKNISMQDGEAKNMQTERRSELRLKKSGQCSEKAPKKSNCEIIRRYILHDFGTANNLGVEGI